MSEIYFRGYRSSDAVVVQDLFVESIQTVYPDLDDGDWLADLHRISKYYVRRGGEFVVGLDGSYRVAMGGIAKIDRETAEMKRVAVDPLYQGEGIGNRLVRELEVRAWELGFTRMVLDTTLDQVAARKLYESRSYELVDRREVDHPSGHTFDTFFYQKDLSIR